MKTVMLSVFIGFMGMSGAACANSGNGSSLSGARAAAEAMPGQFVSVGNHHVSGMVSLEERLEGTFLALQEDFMSSSGPDLRLVLRDSTGQVPMRVIAPLHRFSGAQEYALNLTANELAPFDEVVVYCAEFHVDFGIAKLP